MSRMITPEFLCSVFSDTGECLRSAQCVSCVATLAPTHQHWRLCVLILSPGVSTSQHVASVAHQQTGYQLYLWLFFVHCCCKSVTFPAVSRPAQESAAPWWAADPEQRQCVGAVVTSGHQWSPVVTSGLQWSPVVTPTLSREVADTGTASLGQVASVIIWKTSLYVLWHVTCKTWEGLRGDQILTIVATRRYKK